ncbi:hypothetical protein [Aquimarina hainanensis]
MFDADTGAVLVDYIADRTNNDNNPVNSRISHWEELPEILTI